MKKIILMSLMLASAVAAFAGYASEDECVLPADKALDYKGKGNLQCDKEYGGCSSPWDEYGTCFFGYEAIGTISFEYEGISGAFDVCSDDYMPAFYVYGGETEDEANEMSNQLCKLNVNPCHHDKHSKSFEVNSSKYRYFRFRFKRGGSAACGSARVNYIKATRTDAFSFYDGSTKLSDGATVQLSTGVEKSFKISLYGVKHLYTDSEDVIIELVSTDKTNTNDFIKIDNKVFNDFSSDSAKSGYYNLNSSEASMKVKFTQSGTYSIYVNVKHDGMIIQRRYLNFEVSD